MDIFKATAADFWRKKLMELWCLLSLIRQLWNVIAHLILSVNPCRSSALRKHTVRAVGGPRGREGKGTNSPFRRKEYAKSLNVLVSEFSVRILQVKNWL